MRKDPSVVPIKDKKHSSSIKVLHCSLVKKEDYDPKFTPDACPILIKEMILWEKLEEMIQTMDEPEKENFRRRLARIIKLIKEKSYGFETGYIPVYIPLLRLFDEDKWEYDMPTIFTTPGSLSCYLY